MNVVTPGNSEWSTLQTLISPELGVCTEPDLFLRRDGPVGPVKSARSAGPQEGYRFFAGSGARFNTWFNLFNWGTWKRHCDLQSLALLLEGEGRFLVSIHAAPRERSFDQETHVVELVPGRSTRLDPSALLETAGDTALLFFELKVVGEEAVLTRAEWQTADAPRRCPDLALAITTFNREAEVASTIERFARFRATSWLKDHVHLIVSDNGQSLDLDSPDGVAVIPNKNLGGAGGFTRGLMEAKARGASHCLFMDDDASIHMQSLERTWQLLAYAKDSRTAVAGAMISDQYRWEIWENGARFSARCLPLHMGTDLRDFRQVARMEWEVSKPAPTNLYGGWWYFAFPLEHARHLAFPFFVRGDDVSFSLANEFNIVRLNGVASFQESFTEKESPQTWYLDLRSHMAHHLSLPQMEIGAMGVFKIALSFFLRNLPRMHYDTLAAINLAFEDVMQGPSFFDRNIDMAQRRRDIKALTREEDWQDLDPQAELPPERRAPPSAWKRHLMKLTLNGLLVPGYMFIGRKITIRGQDRGSLRLVWGASEITYLNTKRTKFYTVRQSKIAAWREIWRFARNAHAFLTSYGSLQRDYRAAYQGMTSERFWAEKLELPVAQVAKQAAAE